MKFGFSVVGSALERDVQSGVSLMSLAFGV